MLRPPQTLHFVQGFLQFEMVPAMVQDVSSVVPKQAHVANKCYLLRFTMIPVMVQDDPHLVPQLAYTTNAHYL